MFQKLLDLVGDRLTLVRSGKQRSAASVALANSTNVDETILRKVLGNAIEPTLGAVSLPKQAKAPVLPVSQEHLRLLQTALHGYIVEVSRGLAPLHVASQKVAAGVIKQEEFDHIQAVHTTPRLWEPSLRPRWF